MAKYPKQCAVFVHRYVGECQLVEPVNSRYGFFFMPRQGDTIPVGYDNMKPRNAAARELLDAVSAEARK